MTVKTPADNVRTPNPRGSGARLKAEIVAAAIALIDDPEESAPLSLRGVARRTGVSAPSIYAHFEDLDALVAEVLAESFRELERSVGRAVRRAKTPAASLRSAALAYVRFGWNHRRRYSMMFAATGYAPDAVDVFATVRVLIAAAVDAGESHSQDPHADGVLLWVGLHGMATLEKPDRSDYRRLGPLDRSAMVGVLVSRLAQLDPSV